MSHYTVAYGPFEPILRAPQRLVLTVDGDTVVDATYRNGYNERGCANRLTRIPLDQTLHLVSRICGTCSHAHTLAFSMALEALLEQDVPPRAYYLRSGVAEIERLMSHLDALTRLFETIGQTRYANELYELLLQAHQALLLISGNEDIPDMCMPGGVQRNLHDEQRSELLLLCARLNRRLAPLLEKITRDGALSARTVDIGVLVSPAAKQFGLRGPLARASGINEDIRINQPYAAYSLLAVNQIVEEGGDVYARLIVLLLEAFESVKLIEQAINELPDGAWHGAMPRELPAGQASAFVESPHGMLRYTVESDGRRLTNVTIDAPRQLDRLLVRALFVGASIDDVMVIALSTDACLACSEC